METRVKCKRNPWEDEIDVAVFCIDGQNRSIGEPLTMRKLNRDDYVREPTFRLATHEAQQLIDELWGCGLRPSEGTGSAGSLAATERHLVDMQKIALGLLKAHGV